MAGNGPAPHPETPARLSQIISTYRPTKLFRPSKGDISVTSLDFDDTGEFLIAACNDESLQLYNCKEGARSKELFSKKYGAHLARFTHASHSVLYASTKVNDTIRYLSTHDNKYIRYFIGHTSAVTSLSLSPSNDTFISSGLDNGVRLWALNTPNPTGRLMIQDPVLTAFDPTAAVFAVASPSTHSVLMYDTRQYEKSAFGIFDLTAAEATLDASMPSASAAAWTHLEFSNDGRTILLGTAGPAHYLLDAFTGDLTAICRRPGGGTGRSIPVNSDSDEAAGVLGGDDVCFSPDARYLVGGQGSTKLCIWSVPPPEDKSLPAAASAATTAERDRAKAEMQIQDPLHEIESKHRAAIVAFNPRYNLCVSADKAIMLWAPDKDAMVL